MAYGTYRLGGGDLNTILRGCMSDTISMLNEAMVREEALEYEYMPAYASTRQFLPLVDLDHSLRQARPSSELAVPFRWELKGVEETVQTVVPDYDEVALSPPRYIPRAPVYERRDPLVSRRTSFLRLFRGNNGQNSSSAEFPVQDGFGGAGGHGYY